MTILICRLPGNSSSFLRKKCSNGKNAFILLRCPKFLARCLLVNFRPLPFAPPATGGTRVAPQTRTSGSRPFRSPAPKKHDPDGVVLFWHILHNLIQCNAKERSVAFVKLSILYTKNSFFSRIGVAKPKISFI